MSYSGGIKEFVPRVSLFENKNNDDAEITEEQQNINHLNRYRITRIARNLNSYKIQYENII